MQAREPSPSLLDPRPRLHARTPHNTHEAPLVSNRWSAGTVWHRSTRACRCAHAQTVHVRTHMHARQKLVGARARTHTKAHATHSTAPLLGVLRSCVGARVGVECTHGLFAACPALHASIWCRSSPRRKACTCSSSTRSCSAASTCSATRPSGPRPVVSTPCAAALSAARTLHARVRRTALRGGESGVVLPASP
jgi:hypothetical protein